MCGFAGTFGGPRPDAALLGRMADTMVPRGPDDHGVWHDEQTGLAFRRLAIVDLDHRSAQPMHWGPWHLAFNGEIYNHVELRATLEGLGHEFRTSGDAEVLLHAWAEWGEQALDRFNGMFAFAIYHDERRELTLAVDPFAEKPLFWHRDGDRLVFGSNARAIQEAVPSLGGARESALAPFLTLGTTPPVDQTFFAGIDRLPAAHLMRVDRDGRISTRRYWEPQLVDVPERFDDATARLRELLTDAVRLRLRADVPIGGSLSGGVDSTAIVGLAASLEPDAARHAFTATFPGFERDEWRYAAAAADSIGVTQHHAVTPTADEVLRDLDDLVLAQEEPFGSLSIYAQYRVNQAAHDAGVTVMLDGQGGDELFGGYAGTAGWATRSRGLRRAIRAAIEDPVARRELPIAYGSAFLPPAVARRHRRSLASAYVPDDVREAGVAYEPGRFVGSVPSTPLRAELLREQFHTSLPHLLRYADRDSMAHSREVRLPLLDRRVAEFALSCPPQFLYHRGETKRILRAAIRDLVPDVILARRDKVAFEPPQVQWLSTPAARTMLGDLLLDPAARARGLWDAERVEQDLGAERWRDHRGLWWAASVELWIRRFGGA